MKRKNLIYHHQKHPFQEPAEDEILHDFFPTKISEIDEGAHM
jgi:hypothetical protein